MLSSDELWPGGPTAAYIKKHLESLGINYSQVTGASGRTFDIWRVGNNFFSSLVPASAAHTRSIQIHRPAYGREATAERQHKDDWLDVVTE